MWKELLKRRRETESLSVGEGRRTLHRTKLRNAVVGGRQPDVDLAEDLADALAHRSQNEDSGGANQNQQQRIFNNILPLFVPDKAFDKIGNHKRIS
jgi:hypothetical protein